MKHNPNAVANAFAVNSGVLYVVCRVAVMLLPDLTMTVAQSWFHGLEINQVSGWELSLGSFVLGVVTLAVAAWFTGYAYAMVYNYFLKK